MNSISNCRVPVWQDGTSHAKRTWLGDSCGGRAHTETCAPNVAADGRDDYGQNAFRVTSMPTNLIVRLLWAESNTGRQNTNSFESFSGMPRLGATMSPSSKATALVAQLQDVPSDRSQPWCSTRHAVHRKSSSASTWRRGGACALVTNNRRGGRAKHEPISSQSTCGRARSARQKVNLYPDTYILCISRSERGLTNTQPSYWVSNSTLYRNRASGRVCGRDGKMLDVWE